MSQAPPSSQALTGGLLVLMGAIFYSSKAIMVKLAYQWPVDPTALLTLRMLFALPFYLFFALRKPRRPPPGPLPDRQAYLGLIATGLTGYYLASLFDFWGLRYVTASLERLILFSYPSLVLLLSAVVWGRRIGGRQALALLLTYLGIAVVMGLDWQPQTQPDFWRGSLLIFLAALAYAIYLMGSERLIPRLGTIRFTAWSMLAATAGILIHSLLSGQAGQLAGLDWPVYSYALLMAIVATLIPSFLIAAGIRRIGAGHAAIIGSIGPVSTILLAYLFLDERLSPGQWMGSLLVILGVSLITVRR
ncbi:MAG: DMT family transporter [Bacteroidetes bacterium]|nr:MAG: DMT family transporter [Bacteroidota bacterium]